jgi:hypothetical protein
VWDPKHLRTLQASTAFCRDNFIFLYVYDIRASSARYRDSFTFLVDDVHTSQETRSCACTVCYGDRFLVLYVYDVRTSQEIHRLPRPVTGIALLFIYADDVRTSQEATLRTVTACYADSFTY